MKIFNLFLQAQDSIEAQSMKWAFLGSKKLYQTIEYSTKNENKQKKGLDVQFHEDDRKAKQAKVYLIAKEGDESKVIMEWGPGISFKQISKYIAKHKYKKYLKEVNF